MTYRGGSYLFGHYGVCALCCVACPFGGSIAPSQTREWTSYCASPFSILPTINCKPNLRGGKLVWRSQSDALGARCVLCNFSIFSCAHLGSSARNLSKRPKWSTYVESKVIGVKLLCLEGLVDYSIQAEDIMIYLCAFQGTFGCFFANIAVFCPS